MQFLIPVILTVILVYSLYTDLRCGKVYNYVTLPAALVGFVLNVAFQGVDGAIVSIEGWALGIGLFLLPFVLGGMGGGDVKLLAAIGAFLGPELVFKCFVYTAIVGGVIAVFLLLRRRQVGATVNNLLGSFYTLYLYRYRVGSSEAGRASFPYAVAIAVGGLSVLYLR